MREAIQDRRTRQAATQIVEMDRVDCSPLPSHSRRITFFVIALSCIFIYLQVFALPCTPHLATGDQAIYLHNATRMLNGEMIYRDYDHFTLPGTDVVYAALFKCFGVRAWIPQAVLVVLGAALVWLTIFISREFINGASAYLPGLLFIALPFSSYLDATHHWFSLVAVTGGPRNSAARPDSRAARPRGCLWEYRNVLHAVDGAAYHRLRAFPAVGACSTKETWSELLKKEVSLAAGFVVTITLVLHIS